MPNFYQDEIKPDAPLPGYPDVVHASPPSEQTDVVIPQQVLPANITKSNVYSAFTFNVDPIGNILPSASKGADVSSRFGGNGTDGALSISTGTTTIDLGAADTLIKNYTTISITGTGKLAFSNPGTNGTLIILKSQGDVTLTSTTAPMIDASGMGSAGGAFIGTGNDGNNGSLGNSTVTQANFGNGGKTGVNGGTGGAASVAIVYILTSTGKIERVSCGAGGGGGASPGGTNSGAGGRGGGGLIIECGGKFNFTTANGISVAGTNGTNADTPSSVNNVGAGGGGGGGGGVCAILYNTLTANTGTITKTGGNGGNGGAGNGTSAGVTGSGGGSGGANLSAGGAGGAGGAAGANAGANGVAGSGTGGGTGGTGGAAGVGAAGGGGGGGGSAGSSYVIQNVDFT